MPSTVAAGADAVADVDLRRFVSQTAVGAVDAETACCGTSMRTGTCDCGVPWFRRRGIVPTGRSLISQRVVHPGCKHFFFLLVLSLSRYSLSLSISLRNTAWSGAPGAPQRTWPQQTLIGKWARFTFSTRAHSARGGRTALSVAATRWISAPPRHLRPLHAPRTSPHPTRPSQRQGHCCRRR